MGSTVNAITQTFELATNDKRHKLELLIQALTKAPPPQLTLVFVQKKRTASWVAGQLTKTYGVKAESIHGDRSQSQRENALAAFKRGDAPVMVATDVAARGIDVPGVAHVVNFDMPSSADDFDSYVHRIGRTGRAGREGLATSFFVPGFDPKTGNGKIAPLLATLLREQKKEVPDFFFNGGGGGGGGGGGAPKPAPQRDARAPAQQRGGGGGGRGAAVERRRWGGGGAAAAVIYAPASAAAQLCRCSKRPRPIFRSRSRRPMAAGPPPRSDVTGDRHAGASGHGYC